MRLSCREERFTTAAVISPSATSNDTRLNISANFLFSFHVKIRALHAVSGLSFILQF